MATIVIIAEDNGEELSQTSLSAINSAFELQNETVDILLLGNVAPAPYAAKVEGIRKVITAHSNHLSAEDAADLLRDMAQDYSYFIAAASHFSRAFMPRLAALLDVQMISEIIGIESADTFTRPIYAGNAIAHVRSLDEKKVFTIKSSAFKPCTIGNAQTAEISALGDMPDNGYSELISTTSSKGEGPDLTTAKIVIGGGIALKNRENYNELIGGLAEKLGAATGATRDAVHAGFTPNDHQIGQTGKTIAPDLYIAVGLSGNSQHVAGIRDAKIIVAINSDPDASILEHTDYYLKGDLFEIVPKLKALL